MHGVKMPASFGEYVNALHYAAQQCVHHSLVVFWFVQRIGTVMMKFEINGRLRAYRSVN